MRTLTRLLGLALGLGAALSTLRPERAFAEGEVIVVPDATADPNNTGNGRGAILGVRLNESTPGQIGNVSIIADGTNVAPPLVAPAFRRPRGAAVDPRNDNFILVADSDANPSGLPAVGAPSDPAGALFWVNRTTGQVVLFSDGSGLIPAASAFVNPVAVTFSSGCSGGRDTPCAVYVVDETANPRCGLTGCLVSPWTGKKPGAIYKITAPTAGGLGGAVDIRSDGCLSEFFACNVPPTTTIFGQLRGLAAMENSTGLDPQDVLYVADSAADVFGAELGGSGNRPGVVWQIGSKSPTLAAPTKVFLATDGTTGTQSQGPFLTPFAVALDLFSATQRLILADADKPFGATPLKTTAGEPSLPGSLFSAPMLPGDPMAGARLDIDGKNDGGSPLPPPPPCFVSGTNSIFVNPSGLLVVQDDDLCPAKPKLAVVDADARLDNCSLTQKFDFVRPGGVLKIDLATGGIGGTIFVVSDGKTCPGCPALPPGSTTYFSTPQRPSFYRDPTYRCRETAHKSQLLLPTDTGCYQNAGQYGQINLALLDMAGSGTCDCTSFQPNGGIINDIATKLTCAGACADPTTCNKNKVTILCRLCTLHQKLGCGALPAACPVLSTCTCP